MLPDVSTMTQEQRKQLLVEMRTNSINGLEPTDEEWTTCIRAFIANREEDTKPKDKKAPKISPEAVLNQLINI